MVPTEILSANIIAKNLLAQVDDEGHRQLLLDEIVDHHTNQYAIPWEQGMYQTASGLLRFKRTT